MKVDLRYQGDFKPYQPTGLERAYDGVLKVFAPRVAMRNAYFREARHAFGYEGARITRLRMNATRAGTITSNTPLNASDRLQLVWEARDLAMNDPFIHGLLDKMAHYIVGPKITIEVMSGNPDDDHAIEDWLYECMENCDLTGRSKYTDYTRLSLISVIRDGDFGATYNEDISGTDLRGRPLPYLKLQACESDVIGGYHYWIENNCVSGVVFDPANGKVLGYRVYPRNNYGFYSADYTFVPADKFTFFSYRQRTDQYRGVSALASAIPTARDIKEIILNEKMGVKWANHWAGFIKTAQGDAAASDPASVYQAEVPTGGQAVGAAGAAGGPGSNIRYYETFRPGEIGYLAPGEEIQSAAIDRPSTSFNGFLALLYRQICVSVNVPFGFAFDTSQLGGTVARLESAQAKRTFEWWGDRTDDDWHQPNFRKWIAYGLITGRLRLSRLAAMPKIIVNRPAHPTVDVGRESRANVTEYEAGLNSFTSICKEQGKNPVEEANRMANDVKLKIDAAKSRGIPVELIEPKLVPPSGGRQSGQGGAGGGGDSDSSISQGLSKVGPREVSWKQIADRMEDVAEKLEITTEDLTNRREAPASRRRAK